MWESSREDRFESMKKHMVRLTLRLAELDLMLGFGLWFAGYVEGRVLYAQFMICSMYIY